MTNQQEITLRIHCHHLPGTHFVGRTAVRLGIQKGQEVIDDVAADVESVTFTVPLRVATNLKHGQPNFLGAFAHGTPDDRFIYLSWGERKGASWDMFRRAKLALRQLSWERLENAWQTGAPIEMVVAMTDAKGGPACASLKFD